MFSSIRKGDSFSDFAETPNQKEIASQVLDSLLSSDPDHPVVEALLILTTTEQAQAAFDLLTGEAHVSLKGDLLNADHHKVAAINSRIHGRLRNAEAQTSTAGFANLSSLVDDQSGLWISGYSFRCETDSSSSSAKVDTDLGGILIGIDRALNDRLRFGIVGGYGKTDVNLPAQSFAASVDTRSLGVYGGAEAGASRFSFGTIYAGYAIDASRTILISDLSERLSSRYDAHSWQLFSEASHRIQAADIELEPFIGMSSISLHTDGFSERGGVAALTAPSDSNHTIATTLGIRNAIGMEDAIQMRTMVGRRHVFGDTSPAASFRLANRSAGRIQAAPIAQDALVTELGLETNISDIAVLGVVYSGLYGDSTTTHGIRADFKLMF